MTDLSTLVAEELALPVDPRVARMVLAARDQGALKEVLIITAGLAAAGALGVPWTHRDHAQGVLLVTGHAREGGAPPDWPALGAAAAAATVLQVNHPGTNEFVVAGTIGIVGSGTCLLPGAP